MSLPKSAPRGERLPSNEGSRHDPATYARLVDVRLLYFDGCPNWQETDQRLQQAMRQAGVATTVEHVIVSTPEDAERMSFRGSPTVLVNGQDPFADPAAPIGLSCRVYQTAAGLRGSPTTEQLVRALTGERPLP